MTTRKEISSFWTRVQKFHQQNLESARIILREVERYGGETAGLVIWARMVVREAQQNGRPPHDDRSGSSRAAKTDA
jgi:hypothetical protein